MRRRLLLNMLLAALALTLAFLLAQWLMDLFLDEEKSLTERALDALVRGVMYGPALVLFLALANRRARRVTKIEDAGELGVVTWAADRGPVPDDRRLRLAARELAVENLKRLRRMLPLVLGILGFTALGFLIGAVLVDPWLGFGVLPCGVLLIMAANAPRRVQRRIDLLSDEPGTLSAATPSK